MEEINSNDLKVTSIVFIILVMLIAVYQHIQQDKLQQKVIQNYQKELLKVQLELTEVKEHYIIALDNLNSMNIYATELEDKLDKLEKLDRVYKEIGRIYNK